MIVAGVDPSLTCTGVAVVGDRRDIPPETRAIRTKPEDGPVLHRMRYLVGETFAAVQHADLVVMEGLSFGSHGSATRDLAGLWWMLADVVTARVRLLHPGRDLAVVAPDTLKLWVTGNGRAGKREVREHITRRWHLQERITYDEADALGLASMGLHHAGALPWTPTQAQERAVRTPQWTWEVAA